MRHAGKGWIGRMPVAGCERCPRCALAACLLVLALPAVAQAALPGALTQYSDGSDNWATTGSVPTSYALGATLGFLAPTPTPGTGALYGCASGPDHFLSLDPGCEGQTVLGTQGYVYASPPSTGASSPVYSCLSASTSTEDHFVSTSSACGGALSLGLLGYVLDSAPLDRYNGGFHWVTTGSPPAGYGLEGTLGYLVNGGPGTSPLYGCIQNNDQFLSLDRGCEGQALIGLEGWIYASPPANAGSVAVYRCSVPDADHFAADDPNCEGQHTDGLLGDALGQPIGVPTAAASAPATTVIPPPISPTRPHARLLHTSLKFQWRWHRSSTRLKEVLIRRLPRRATVRVACHGTGRGCRGRAVSGRLRHLRRLIRSLTGRVYRPGDRISVSVTARGYQPIRARITIRADKIPTVALR